MATGHSVRHEIAGIAAQMIRGEVDLLVGCRAIVCLRGNLLDAELNDPDLDVIVAVESELDDVPQKSAAQLWDPVAFAEKLEKAAEYMATVRPELVRACEALVRRWASQ